MPFKSGLRIFASRALRYVWALRVPAVSAAILVGLPTFGFRDTLRPFVSGLFDPVGEWALAPIVALALLSAWTVVIIASLILRYGPERLELPPTNLADFPLPWGWWLGGTIVLAGPIIYRTVKYSTTDSWGWQLMAGVLAAIVLGLGAVWIQRVVHKKERKKDSAFRRGLARLARSPMLSAGFLQYTDGGFIVAPGHGVAFGLAAGSIVLYVVVGVFTRDVHRPWLASALAYVLLLVLMLTWLAGFVAFLFDRLRLPLVLLLTVWILVVTYVIDYMAPTDHVYHTVKLEGAAPLATVPQLFDETPTPIVVAASGGGIQAAAWTARVMTALDAIGGFRSSLRVVSAVSGGSVGAMNLLASWEGCGPDTPPRDQSFDANDASRESSLHAAGWGLVFEDLPRSIFPFLSNPYSDRGSLLEEAWKREPRLTAPFLSAWRSSVATHTCPGVVFNSMVAETGEPMLFSTIALPDTLAPFSFYSHYPDRDLSMTTAVRLSAAFPYVSAASRADVDGGALGYSHLVDGGYFDNYGVGSLLPIVDVVLDSIKDAAKRRHLLVVEICDATECSGQQPVSSPSAGGRRRAWPYQILAPLSALVAERSAAQRMTNRTALKLLAEDWRTKRTCIEAVHVPFGSADAPMSWHLTQAEKKAVDDKWDAIEASQHIIEAVSKYLKGGAATPEGAACLDDLGP